MKQEDKGIRDSVQSSDAGPSAPSEGDEEDETTQLSQNVHLFEMKIWIFDTNKNVNVNATLTVKDSEYNFAHLALNLSSLSVYN